MTKKKDPKDLKPWNKGKVSNRRDKRLRHIKGEKWAEEKKLQAVTYYVVLGNYRQVERMTGIPEGTIRGWNKTEWWLEAVAKVREEKQDELDSKFTKIIDKTVDNIYERLEKGDVQWDAKNQRYIDKPQSAFDLARVAGIIYDKRALLRGDPTQRIEKRTTDEHLSTLAKEFMKFNAAKTITGEVVEIED